MILNASPTFMDTSLKLYRRRSDAFDATTSDRFGSFFEHQDAPPSSSLQRSTMTNRESDAPYFQGKPRSKRVHFSPISDTQLIVLADEDDCVEDSSVRWYGEDDIRRFRNEFVEQARNIARFNRKTSRKCYGFTLLKLFQECTKGNQICIPCNEDDDYNEEDYYNEDENKLCVTGFEAFCGDTQVGLERMAARQIACDKAKRRQLLARAIRKMQSGPSSIGEQDDLRIACERISQPSRLFAIHLARMSAQGS